MNITSVKITPLDTGNKLQAYASITIDEEFAITGLKIFDSTNGYFVAYPSRKGQDGEYHDIAYPITKESRKEIERIVLTEFQKSNEAIVEPPVQNEEQKKWNKIDVNEDDLPF